MPSVLDTSFDFDPFDAERRAQAYEIYAQLREHQPVFRTGSGYWMVTKFDDVRNVLNDATHFSNRPQSAIGMGIPSGIDPDVDPESLSVLQALVSGMPVTLEELTAARPIIGSDPPDHTRLRGVVNRAFTPARIEKMRAVINQIVADCLVGIESATTFDLMARLAVPLPVRVIGDLMGIEPERHKDIKRWTDELNLAAHGEGRGTAQAQIGIVGMLREFSDYLVPRIEQRRVEPNDDLIGLFVNANSDEVLTTTEVLMSLLTFMLAGNETTTNTIGNLVNLLLQHPAELDKLRANPELVPNAVEESIRFAPSVKQMFREAKADAIVRGVKIPEGEVVIVALASANRDFPNFDDPNDFKVDRDIRSISRHMSFGHGVHYCLGAHLARMEAQTALAQLLPHLGDFAIDEQTRVPVPSMILQGWQHLELIRRET